MEEVRKKKTAGEYKVMMRRGGKKEEANRRDEGYARVMKQKSAVKVNKVTIWKKVK